jgi:hypothetical protein
LDRLVGRGRADSSFSRFVGSPDEGPERYRRNESRCQQQSTEMAKMGKVLGRRAGPWGTALVLWDVWKRIPPKHRKRILQQARKHGPRLAEQAIKARQKRRIG